MNKLRHIFYSIHSFDTIAYIRSILSQYYIANFILFYFYFIL